MMPKIDGFETCRRLKKNEATRDIPVIFMTALTETIDKVKGFEVGGVDYITKPFQHEEVLARVNAHLTIRNQQKHIQIQNWQLKELNVCKDKFISIISHDLRSPFTGIFILAEQIRRNVENRRYDELQHLANQLQASVENYHALLENLLTWSKIQQGIIKYAPQFFDVQQVFAKNIALFTPNAEQKQITLRSVIQEQLIIYADINMIDTVMRNLISNALKFTKAGGVVEVSVTHNENEVTVVVSDTGIGISSENLPQLFQIESKYQCPGTSGERGTGLGLILCKEFVEKHDGRIWIESPVGKGTMVTFTLPKAHGEENT
jgi:signal transduction histidine kinase